MECRRPCINFNNSGPKDIIDHKINSYLAKYKDASDLSNGIKWILEDYERNNLLGKNAIDKVEREYSITNIAQKRINLYASLL